MSDVTVVHLVWRPFGKEMVQQFLDAYQRYPAGYEHRLLVALNGFTNNEEREGILQLFASIEHDVLVMPEPVQDIRVYLATARHVRSEFVCFLNSYSAPLDTGWLAKLVVQATRPGVGLVGASGSWQTMYDALVGDPAERPPRTWRPRKWAGWTLRSTKRLIRVLRVRRHFIPFPNVHLRSNAFMLRRTLFLELDTGPLLTKEHAYRFENGRRSMTRQVLARGLSTLVVGRDGVGYPPEAWPTSRTYRNGEQENLLIADNQTRLYDVVADRGWLRQWTWGPIPDRHGSLTSGSVLPIGPG